MHDERENSKELAAQPSEKSFEQREIKRGTTPYTRSELEQYCEVHSSSPSALCADIDAYTQKNFELARMIIGSWHASFLQFLITTTRAQRVLEIGTFTGYSALAMAEVLPADGEVITVDINSETTQLARSFWDKSAAGKKIKAINKPALAVLEELTGEFDLVFIDADKENVKAYFEGALRLLSPHGFVAVDNSFMDGAVLNSKTASDSVRAMAEFNNYIATRKDVRKVLINIRDGLYLIARV